MKSDLCLIFLLLCLIPRLGLAKTNTPSMQIVCPGRVFLQGEKKIKFSKVEAAFLCGEPEVEAWKFIPLAQVKFHLGTFLQERGYFSPQFTEQGDSITVQLGETTRFSRLEVEGEPPQVGIEKRRKLKGRLLTPRLLDEIEAWIVARLRSHGYPCPKVTSQANILNGAVAVQIEPGPLQDVASVMTETVEALHPGVLRRFDAFVIGKRFNEDLLDLTSRRIETDGLLQNNYFTHSCAADGAELMQHTYAGKPRIARFGVGADTEQLAIVQGSWRHTRLGEKASAIDVSAFASYRKQEIKASFDWYLLKPQSRWHLMPLISVRHEREPEYQLISADAQIALASGWDQQKFSIDFSAGPNLNYVQTFRGAETGLTRFFTMEYDARLTSHYFEYYPNSPRSGYELHLQGSFSHHGLLSEITAQRLSLEGHYLYNFRGYDPPLFILGVRGGFYATFASNDDTTLAELPPTYKYYLGGSENLRGFPRKQLPGPNGALTAAFLSIEARMGYIIPYRIQPFAFLDAGILGERSMDLNGPFYYSPGLGIRYESPLGVFRGTAARGFKSSQDAGNSPTAWKFYISYGEEF